MLSREERVQVINDALIEKLFDDCPDYFPDTEDWAEQIVRALEKEEHF